MKRLLLFLICVLTLFGVSQAETNTVSMDFSEQGYSNEQTITSINIDNVVTLSFSNSTKYYNTGTAIRVYGGGNMTVKGPVGSTLKKIDLTFGSGDGNNQISVDSGNYTDKSWNGSASSVKFTIGGTSGHRRIKAISVTYDTSDGGGAEPAPSGDRYELINDVKDLEAGAKYIIAHKNGSNYYAMNTTVTSNKIESDKVTVSSNVLTPVASTAIFTLVKDGEKWKLQRTDNSQYLNVYTSGTNLNFNTTGTLNSIGFEGDYVKIDNDRRVFPNSDNKYGSYATSNWGTSGYYKPSLYKLIESSNPGTKEKYTGLDKYDETEDITFDLKGDYTLDLGESHPIINYEYEPTGIIKIDTNGKITATNTGEVIVSATWDEDTNWYASEEEIMFTVTVTDDSQGEVTPPQPVDGEWTLVNNINDLKNGDQIVFVYDASNGSQSYAMANEKGTSNNDNYRPITEVSINYANPKSVEITDKVMILEIEYDNSNSEYPFAFLTKNYQSGDNGYIGNHTTSNQCNISSSKGNGYRASVTISDEIATVNFNNEANKDPKPTTLFYNNVKGSERFSCYASTQSYPKPKIFKKTNTQEKGNYTELEKYAESGIDVTVGETLDLELGESHPDISYKFDPIGYITIENNKLKANKACPDVVKVTASWEAGGNWNAGSTTFTVKVNKVDYVPSFDKKTYNLKVGESVALELGESYPEEIIFVSNTDIEDSINEKTFVITGKNEGSFTITAAWEGNDKYNEGEAEFTVNVTKDPNSYTVIFVDNATDAPAAASWSDTSLQGYFLLGKEFLSNASEIEKVFKGIHGLKFGTNESKGSIKFSLSEEGQVNATKIVVNAETRNVNNSIVVSVNGVDNNVSGNTPKLYTYELTDGGLLEDITIATGNGTDYVYYVKSFTVYYTPNEPQDYTALDGYEDEEISFELGKSYQLELGSSHPEIHYDFDPEEGLRIDENGEITATIAREYFVTATWSADNIWNGGEAVFIVEVTESTVVEPEIPNSVIDVTISDGRIIENEDVIEINLGQSITFSAAGATSWKISATNEDFSTYYEKDSIEGESFVWTPESEGYYIDVKVEVNYKDGTSEIIAFYLSVIDKVIMDGKDKLHAYPHAGDQYELISNNNQLIDGCHYVIAYTGGKKAMSKTSISTNRDGQFDPDEVEINGTTLIATDNTLCLYLTIDNDNLYHWNFVNYEGIGNGLGYSGRNFTVSSTDPTNVDISSNGDALIRFDGSTTNQFLYRDGKESNGFKNYASSNLSNPEYHIVQIYKLSKWEVEKIEVNVDNFNKAFSTSGVNSEEAGINFSKKVAEADVKITLTPKKTEGAWATTESKPENTHYHEAFDALNDGNGLKEQHGAAGKYVDGFYYEGGAKGYITNVVESDLSGYDYDLKISVPCSGVYTATVESLNPGFELVDNSGKTPTFEVTIYPNLHGTFGKHRGFNIEAYSYLEEEVTGPRNINILPSFFNKSEESLKACRCYIPGTYFADSFETEAQVTDNNSVNGIGSSKDVKRRADSNIAANYVSTVDLSSLKDKAEQPYSVPVNVTVKKNGAVGNYTFMVASTQNAATGVDEIEAVEAEAEYFNLQGLKIKNPERGQIYIKVVGNKATKVIM